MAALKKGTNFGIKFLPHFDKLNVTRILTFHTPLFLLNYS